MKNILKYDVIILGGGPAGLSAGMYSARANLNVAIIDVNTFGGQPANYLEIENYLGYSRIGGYDLMEKFEAQALSFGVKKYECAEIISVDLVSSPKIIETKDAVFEAKSVIIATGASPKKLGLKNELEYVGRGISYCAICDGAFYKDKVVAVAGGGNSAIEEAVYLTKFASKVYLIHRRDSFRADKIVQDKLQNNEKVEVIYSSNIVEIIAEDRVKALKLENVENGECSILNVDGLFVYIGLVPNVNCFNGQINQDECGFIKTDEFMQTSLEGVYAVGDVRTTPLRQVITAVSDGAIASVYSAKYIEKTATVNV